MNPIQWCNRCLCDLELQVYDCKMTSDTTYHLPLNVYVIILGIGLFILMLSMIFCCYLFSLRRQGTREEYGYAEVYIICLFVLKKTNCFIVNQLSPPLLSLQVVLKGAGKKLSLLGQTCAVCLEEFRSREELGVCPCSHAFHKRCLVKWLEIRSVCPMCNKPICRIQPDPSQSAEILANPLGV
uniref:RING finger protein 122 n=1 Tax=Electrophorus electricus TaxID=8005 RepID=A0A4W4ETS0_ELEEL